MFTLNGTSHRHGIQPRWLDTFTYSDGCTFTSSHAVSTQRNCLSVSEASPTYPSSTVWSIRSLTVQDVHIANLEAQLFSLISRCTPRRKWMSLRMASGFTVMVIAGNETLQRVLVRPRKDAWPKPCSLTARNSGSQKPSWRTWPIHWQLSFP